VESPIYNQKGKRIGSILLPDSIFGMSNNENLVHQIMTSMESNARITIAHTKDRSEVRGGGRKPWRQKGTGRARHGSRRSPIWRTGGVTFGPTKMRNFYKKINKKMNLKALYTVLSAKIRDDEVLFVDKLIFDGIKTRYAKDTLSNLASIPGFKTLAIKKKNAASIFVLEHDQNILKSFHNIGNVSVCDIRNMNLLDILRYKYIVIVDPEKSVSLLESKINKKSKNDK